MTEDAGLSVGDSVSAGTFLGCEDDVGCASGTHLHFEVGVPEDPADPIDRFAIGEEEYRRFEWQANSLAGLILVPGPPLKSAFQNVAATLAAAGVEPRQLDHYPTREYVIRDLAKQFAVSEQTMEIRLERDGLLAKLTGKA